MSSRKQQSGCVERLMRWIMRIILGLVAFAVLLGGAGVAYQVTAAARDQRNYPPPGQLVDIGEHRLHLYCTGSDNGGPTVVMDAGLGGFWLDWSRVQPEVERFARVCTYDRAGMGWSDVGPLPRDARQIVNEWHTLMQKSGIPAPYVLVGHSIGGLHAQLYASQYPDEVAALVLVDPTITATEAEIRAKLPPERSQEIAQVGPQDVPVAENIVLNDWVSQLSYVGGVRLLGKQTFQKITPLPEVPLEDQPIYQAIISRSNYLGSYLDELASVQTSIGQVRDAHLSLGPKPLILLAHGMPGAFAEQSAQAQTAATELLEPVNQEIQEQLASTLSTNSKFVLAEKSAHYIQFDQPDLVIKSICEIMAELQPAASGAAAQQRCTP